MIVEGCRSNSLKVKLNCLPIIEKRNTRGTWGFFTFLSFFTYCASWIRPLTDQPVDRWGQVVTTVCNTGIIWPLHVSHLTMLSINVHRSTVVHNPHNQFIFTTDYSKNVSHTKCSKLFNKINASLNSDDVQLHVCDFMASW